MLGPGSLGFALPKRRFILFYCLISLETNKRNTQTQVFFFDRLEKINTNTIQSEDLWWTDDELGGGMSSADDDYDD